MVEMGRLTPAMAAVALALAVGACADDAVIAVDVTWSEELAATFTSDDQLRIHVGYPASSGSFDRSDEAFWEETALAFPGTVRYLLRPDGEVERVGDLQIVASVAGPRGPRAFGAAASKVRFAAGEVRVVPIALAKDDTFVLGGDGDRCVAWGIEPDGKDGVAIGEPDNLDCDSFPDADDCAPFVASDPGDPEICDAIDQACDEALLDKLPCRLAGPQPLDPSTIGVHQCDEGGVGWKACAAASGAELMLPSDSVVAQRLGVLADPARDCLHAPDPLRCAGGSAADEDPTCATDASLGGCEERLLLQSVAGAVQLCRVQIFGGTIHGEWEVGFAEPNNPSQLHAIADTCMASLVIRARSPKVVPRTVLVQGVLGKRMFFEFVRLVPGDDGVCGAPSCRGVFAL